MDSPQRCRREHRGGAGRPVQAVPALAKPCGLGVSIAAPAICAGGAGRSAVPARPAAARRPAHVRRPSLRVVIRCNSSSTERSEPRSCTYLQESQPGQALPLVLALHGYGGSGPRMEPYSGFSAVADRYGFLVAYPSSSGRYWNSTAAPGQANDVRFLAELIDQLEQTMCVDPQRVFATGVSNGGSMVALAACELSSRIAAIASVSGDYSRQPPCRPARPVSVLEIHGTADQVVPYFGKPARRTTDGVPPFVNGWVARDECARRCQIGLARATGAVVRVERLCGRCPGRAHPDQRRAPPVAGRRRRRIRGRPRRSAGRARSGSSSRGGGATRTWRAGRAERRSRAERRGRRA